MKALQDSISEMHHPVKSTIKLPIQPIAYKQEYQNPNLQNKLHTVKNFVYKMSTLESSSAVAAIKHFHVDMPNKIKKVLGSVSYSSCLVVCDFDCLVILASKLIACPLIN